MKNEEQKQTTSPKRYMKSENKNMNVIAGKDAGAGIIKVTGNDRYYMTDANSCAGTTLHLQIR